MGGDRGWEHEVGWGQGEGTEVLLIRVRPAPHVRPFSFLMTSLDLTFLPLNLATRFVQILLASLSLISQEKIPFISPRALRYPFGHPAVDRNV